MTADAPQTFMVHAGDDPHSAAGSARLYLALKQAGVPAELHVYAGGGHGFGMLDRGSPVCQWPARCADWLRSQGFTA